MVRAELEPGTAGLRIQHAEHSVTLPPLEIFSSILTISAIVKITIMLKLAVVRIAQSLSLAIAVILWKPAFSPLYHL